MQLISGFTTEEDAVASPCSHWLSIDPWWGTSSSSIHDDMATGLMLSKLGAENYSYSELGSKIANVMSRRLCFKHSISPLSPTPFPPRPWCPRASESVIITFLLRTEHPTFSHLGLSTAHFLIPRPAVSLWVTTTCCKEKFSSQGRGQHKGKVQSSLIPCPFSETTVNSISSRAYNIPVVALGPDL